MYLVPLVDIGTLEENEIKTEESENSQENTESSKEGTESTEKLVQNTIIIRGSVRVGALDEIEPVDFCTS